jgi:hypothetical protein
VSTKKFRFAVDFVEAMNELLESLKPSLDQPVHDNISVSNTDSRKMARRPGEPSTNPESEDKFSAASTDESSHPELITLAGALEDEVPTVKVDTNGKAYLSE